jgi:integrase/recombinase XerD
VEKNFKKISKKLVLSLKISDIDSKRNIIMIRVAKGNNDRLALLSSKLLSIHREYY